ncbi:MAG: DUF362 domain-containing protein [Deltaproteobacteria bacterium]|nr:DUF362 domain-containing protein [Deltaproteobacteria bacterium]
MEPSNVYFADLRASFRTNLLSKVTSLLESINLKGTIRPRDLTAIKLHFGEKGNLAFIRPNFIRRIVDYARECGAYPFLTDTNTLYTGARGNSVSHLNTAIENGFAYAVVNAPIIIADGLMGGAYEKVAIDKEIIKEAFIAKDIYNSDSIISVAHFKGHEVSGFGGSIKNVGMGCASRRGKLQQHSDLLPKIKVKKCIGCGDCAEHCAQSAISVIEKKAVIDPERCVGCGECIIVCPNGAIDVQWGRDTALFQKKLAEYAFAALKGKEKRSVFINFLLQISPACDCVPFNDAPIVRDLGIMASRDPVAVDQASVDMVNRQAGLDGSCLKSNKEAGEDKFRGVYPGIDWNIQLEHAEEIGLGTRKYKLIEI